MFENTGIVQSLVFALVIFLVGLVNEKDPFNKMLSSLHLFQLEEYNIQAYKKWLKNNSNKVLGASGLIESDKTPIVYTDRMNRLIKRNKEVNRLIYLFLILLSLFVSSTTSRALILIVSLVPIYAQPLVVAISGRIQDPKEKEINQGFYDQAQKKIKNLKEENDLKVIGITGSYGKTSTKFICADILSEKFKTQNTPSSFNTPMGLSKVINNDLDSTKEIFVAEMGAYVPGEIKEVADLVYPDIGILTSIGPMHLETFGSIENIIKTKYELIDALDQDAVAIFNYDDENLRVLADAEKRPTIKYGLRDIEKLDVYATNIKTTREGSSFSFHIKNLGKIDCKSQMLGRHNILNLLAGASVGFSLGMNLDEIKAGIARTKPVDHRLSLIQGANGTSIIDDAFNSNPQGAKAALDVLEEFDANKKIIVTPGMIGLGQMEEEANYNFGKQISRVCDLVYLVGEKRTRPIRQGLVDAGFDEGSIVTVDSLDQASRAFGPLLEPGDVILFENDLPDNYSEV